MLFPINAFEPSSVVRYKCQCFFPVLSHHQLLIENFYIQFSISNEDTCEKCLSLVTSVNFRAMA
jgi:hypothetical protein